MNSFERLPSILSWYDENRRELPWRQDKEPYHVWLSEIMLQQTRVEAVKEYYLRFLSAVPTIDALAVADDELLQKLWEGLGYYSRVRNLKKAANVIMSTYNGHFPTDHASVLALPGIGDYTAGAICSICFDAPTPAVDGNVLRLISRLTADPTPIDSPAYKKQVRSMLCEVYPPRAGDFTQALMELGATLCGPNRKPDCKKCPCRDFCKGYQMGVADSLPVKSPKKGRKIEEKTIFVLSCNGRYALTKRPDTGLLASLWQFPEAPGKLDLPAALAVLEEWSLTPREVFRQSDKTHIFTHVQWDMRCYYLEVSTENSAFIWRTANEIDQHIALPTAFRQFWEVNESL